MSAFATAAVVAFCILSCSGSLASELDISTPVGHIIGGETATKDRFHWFSGLVYKRCETSGQCGWARTACGASLIHPDILLTAAHCIPYLQDEVGNNAAYIGMHSPFQSGNGGQDKDIIALEKIVVHPDYDRFSQEHDLALLKLESPSDATPVKLDDGTNDMGRSTVLTALGYGIESVRSKVLTDQVKELDLLFVSNDICSLVYDDYYADTGHITDDMMCAQALRPGTDTCTGDSGGPLFIRGRSEEYDVQVGVTSFGIECAEDYPGAYTSVSSHFDYIASVICQYSSLPHTECREKSPVMFHGDDISKIDKKGLFYDERRGRRTSCVRLRRFAKRRRRKAKRFCRESTYKSSCPTTCKNLRA
mmetsp:Transcript_4112/g.8748  ORF Transcript_4112/g.8748 Transcript_4112/m.8748 type:complete len:363 (-) Transcript_4112:114-1202(-)|eukprot:CAMPEP_0178528894 /NCGR_PEP_ID=MMETSP0696-20121128/32044_1 /TAXON_ID=265572 /ORGANISM="Extubocellulus spinifer, Strain CCMP396" /LENGTH=362 /DNA_ID=CAMNT_0020160575 /DNA_START=138 /DNA_END=1226 /DNA_ORIENTATION=+